MSLGDAFHICPRTVSASNIIGVGIGIGIAVGIGKRKTVLTANPIAIPTPMIRFKPLRAAHKLKPMALPKDTYFRFGSCQQLCKTLTLESADCDPVKTVTEAFEKGAFD